jgi:hypothetical protein
LTADLSLFLTGRIDFDCRFISSPDWADWFWLQIYLFSWLGGLILTVDRSVCLIWAYWFWLQIFIFEMGLTPDVAGDS